MSPKRKQCNRGLPERWVMQHGAYYYVVPEHRIESLGCKWLRLGKTLAESYAKWATLMDDKPMEVYSFHQLFDKYEAEVIPLKSLSTQITNKKSLVHLRPVFGGMRIDDLIPQDVYKYCAKRPPAAGKNEKQMLSHCLTKAVEWGIINRNVILGGQVRLPMAKARDRYLTDEELDKVRALEQTHRHQHHDLVKAYIEFKLLTGWRQRDILLLTMSDIQEDGIHITPSKTKNKTGKSMVYEWSSSLHAAVDELLKLRPCISPFIICDNEGKCMVDEEGKAERWLNLWQQFMKQVVKHTDVPRFTDHDVRRKVGSDASDLNRAQQFMGHASSDITKRVYRAKPEKVMPTK